MVTEAQPDLRNALRAALSANPEAPALASPLPPDSDIFAFAKELAKPDAILSIVQFLAKRWNQPFSADVLLAGLPLEQGYLTLALLPRALERIGLYAIDKRVAIRELAEFDMPAVVTSKKGKLLVATNRLPRGAVRCFDPATGDHIDIQSDAPEWNFRQKCLSIKPASERDAGDADTGKITQRHWLRAALSGHGKSLAYVMLAATFVNAFAIAMPIFSMNVYDRVLPNKAIATLWVLSIGLLTVFVFDALLKVARAAIIDHVGREMDFRLASGLFDRVINTSAKSRPSSTGAFVNRISQYEVLRDFFTSQTAAMFIDVLFMGVFVLIIASLIGWVVIFPVIAAAISIIGTVVIGKRSSNAVKASISEAGQRNSILVETLSSPQTVKAARAEGQFLRKWENTIAASSETQNKIKWYQSIATQLTSVSSQLATVGIMIGSTYRFADGSITMGAIVASMMLSSRVIAPVAQISAMLLRTRSVMEAYTTLDAIMNMPDERTVRKGFISRTVDKGHIEFRKVRFAYPGVEHHVLDQVSFSIAPGEKVGIIGKIGSGKTTLGRLMVNFYEASEGEILIDGVSIKQYHPAQLRKQIGLVLQDPELFNGSVKDNIVLSDPDADDARIIDVARRSGVEEFVSRHPMGFDMPVGERGFLLSGGQRQAVALARTMLVDPRVLFLDEPSSSMDLATERQLIGNLSRSLAADHTVLIATHRFSLLQLVTRLIVIDNGRIVADGPRDDVLAQLNKTAMGSVQS